MPADDQEMALPCPSVMVMMVLLKVAATCATPTTTFFFSFLRARPALLPALFAASAMTYLVTFFLPAIAFAGAGVGVGTLTADRKALAMAKAAIAAQVHQTLDVHGDVAAQIAFDQKI